MSDTLTVRELVQLLEKQAQVLIQRAEQHGSFDVFARAGEFCGQTPCEVALTMCAVKRARLENNPFNEDSLIDLLNYQAITTIFRVNQLKKERTEE
jgi:hypothetical protein